MQVLPERTFSADEKQQALDLVLRSSTFARADQLRKFLRYICEMEAAGRSDQISEYTIATEALGRPRNYSPAADSGVRGRAHDLRVKIEHFYESEAPEATLRIGLRKGSYSPLYYEVKSQAIKPLVFLPPPVVSETRAKNVFERFGAYLVLLSIIAALSFRTFSVQPARIDRVFGEFWGPLLRPGSDVLICVATPPSLFIKPYRSAPARDVFRPITPDSPWYPQLKIPDGLGQPYMYYSGDSPLFGDAESAVLAAQMITAAGGTFDLLPESTLRPAALRNRNVFLVGSSNYSTYAARILRNAPFFIREDTLTGEEIIQQRSGDGKPEASFVPRRNEYGQLEIVYGLITVFSNQTQSGQEARTIVISGVTSAGASAAVRFFTSKSALTLLRQRLNQSGVSRLPTSYQVVIKGSKDQAVALSWTLAAFKVMQNPPMLE